MIDPSMIHLGELAQLACLLEVTAPKPGNVSPHDAFEDTMYDDFVLSSASINAPLGSAGTRPLGETVLLAIQATRAATKTNTNLGIVLLLAPLARAAASIVQAQPHPWVIEPDVLRASLARVLASTTVDDARHTYAAIRLASPGGLGTADSQDVAGNPTVTLIDAMRLAASRDGIAREYATDFRATFELAAPALATARGDGLDWSDAIVETYLTLLATYPDTHVIRRAGAAVADDVSERARTVLRAGGVRSALGRSALGDMSVALHGDGHRANPGTTADITAAAIFVALLGRSLPSIHGGTDAPAR